MSESRARPQNYVDHTRLCFHCFNSHTDIVSDILTQISALIHVVIMHEMHTNLWKNWRSLNSTCDRGRFYLNSVSQRPTCRFAPSRNILLENVCIVCARIDKLRTSSQTVAKILSFLIILD